MQANTYNRWNHLDNLWTKYDCKTDLFLSVTKLQGVWLWNFEGCARKTSKDNNARAKTVNRTQAINKEREQINSSKLKK